MRCKSAAEMQALHCMHTWCYMDTDDRLLRCRRRFVCVEEFHPNPGRVMSAPPDKTKKPICVVIDTCIWRSNLLLKNPVGMSLMYTLGRQHGVIGFPEIVEG